MTSEQNKVNSQVLMARLTGVLEGIAELTEDTKTARAIYNALIREHLENPVFNSKEWIKSWKAELANIEEN